MKKQTPHHGEEAARPLLQADGLSAPPRLLSRPGMAREFRQHFPIWLVYITSVGMLHATLANVPERLFIEAGIPRRMFPLTALFPLAWFALYFILRIRRSKRLQKRRTAYLALAGLVLGVPLLIFFFYLPYPFTRAQMRALHESSAFFWTALLMVHVLAVRGRQALTMYFGVGLVFGALLENSGIIMGFFREPGYFLYLGPLPAPLCTMVSWSLILAVVISITDRLGEWLPGLSPSRGAWPRAAAATAMALSLDAQIDPLASLAGLFWRWNELLKPVFFGVPLVNFAAWLGAISVFSFIIYRVRGHRDWSPGRRNWELLLRVPLACFLAWAACFALMAAAEGGFGGPSFQILRSFVGRLLGA